MSKEHVFSHANYLWDMRVLDLMRKGDMDALRALLPEFIEATGAEIKAGGLFWMLSAMGFPKKPARVHGYWSVIGTGNAVVEWPIESGLRTWRAAKSSERTSCLASHRSESARRPGRGWSSAARVARRRRRSTAFVLTCSWSGARSGSRYSAISTRRCRIRRASTSTRTGTRWGISRSTSGWTSSSCARPSPRPRRAASRHAPSHTKAFRSTRERSSPTAS